MATMDWNSSSRTQIPSMTRRCAPGGRCWHAGRDASGTPIASAAASTDVNCLASRMLSSTCSAKKMMHASVPNKKQGKSVQKTTRRVAANEAMDCARLWWRRWRACGGCVIAL
eukprot:3248504-Rhodomonas_salina.1